MMNTYSMTQFAATISEAFGVLPPAEAGPAIPAVTKTAARRMPGRADRVLAFHPDCVGMWFWQKYTELLVPVMECTQLAVPVATVMPSVTPVCFGTMYTGAMPAVHGIRMYSKPIITIDSLFDSLPGNGLKTALIAVENSSMATIFQNRNIDYYILPDDRKVMEKAMELVEEDKYHFISVYQQNYDDLIHAQAPESEEAVAAAAQHAQDFAVLSEAVRLHWQKHNTMTVWAPDHGCHVNWDGHGAHGEFREEDINVVHFYGFFSNFQRD